MDRTNSALLFVRVVETSSFSKAAAELGISQPTATKAIAATELRLGMRLLHRSTRGVTLTEFGALYFEKCKLIEQAIEEAENLVSLKEGGAAGQLHISTSVAFGRRMLTPLVLRYMQAHPQVKIDISFDDRYVDLVGQGVDLAIRMGQMADSTLGARYLGSNPWVMVASPDYLHKRGAPIRAQDLCAHTCMVYSSVQGNDRWRLSAPDGKVVTVAVSGTLRSNNLSAVLASACAGMGVAILPWYVAREALADASLQIIMADHSLPAQDVHAVFPSPKLVPQKVTAFMDFLQQSLAGDWWLQAP